MTDDDLDTFEAIFLIIIRTLSKQDPNGEVTVKRFVGVLVGLSKNLFPSMNQDELCSAVSVVLGRLVENGRVIRVDEGRFKPTNILEHLANI